MVWIAAVLFSMISLPGGAQEPRRSSLLLAADAPMTLAEFQGLGCGATGLLAGMATLAYIVDPITLAAIDVTTPLVLLPVLAAGFAVGCSVGATLSPAFLYLYRSWQ